jgi:hypothetical protein
MALGTGRSGGGTPMPQPGVGAALIAASIVILAIGFGWLNNLGDDQVVDSLVGALSPRSVVTNEDGEVVGEIPPSQPAVPVSFGPAGLLIRPEPERARVVDPDTGLDVIIPLPPGTTVVDGRVVPKGTTTTRGSSSTTGSTTSSTTGGSTTSSSDTTSTTSGPTTSSTEEPTTTSTEEPTTTTETPPTSDPGPGLIDSIIDILTP